MEPKQQLNGPFPKHLTNTKQSNAKPQYVIVWLEPYAILKHVVKHVVPTSKLVCIWKPIVLWKPSIRNGGRPVALSSSDVPNAANSNAVNDATTKLDAELGL